MTVRGSVFPGSVFILSLVRGCCCGRFRTNTLDGGIVSIISIQHGSFGVFPALCCAMAVLRTWRAVKLSFPMAEEESQQANN